MERGPKAKFSKKVAENDFLSISVWKGKTHPEDEIIRIQLRRWDGVQWKTEYEMSLYRTQSGQYAELKPRTNTKTEKQ
ncbi:MAG: hypothetical protein JRN10_01990 [Nitrososphaerota archaeon]|jgi:hypothetical protein|nr:hypothetical protein [Nitrososphaerota archaeon]MDG6926874.1 hypothetical protein [Nitrososphaerota archaeon]MDG6930008.1 hypothetical protein [Nitrososphaerota archaeon]MDG6931959.1 hypothetical protein [Nitrososphaerota archaeon]MDG6943838.1 hypothetical protein [Nitrososphaerota archaeon]